MAPMSAESIKALFTRLEKKQDEKEEAWEIFMEGEAVQHAIDTQAIQDGKIPQVRR